MSKAMSLLGRSAAISLLMAAAACGSDESPIGDATAIGGSAAGGALFTGGMMSTGGATGPGPVAGTGGDESTGGVAMTGGTGATPTAGGGPAAGGTSTADLFDTGNPDRNNVSAGDVCGRLSELQCAGEAHCCDSPGRTFEECVATTMRTCRNDAYLDSMTSNSTTGFDAPRAAATLLTYETMALACDVTAASWGETVDGLRGIMQGTIAPGSDCAPKAPTLSAGAAALASCADPENFACLPNAAFIPAWSCDPRADAAGACLTDFNCKPGNYCVQADPLAPVRSTCATRKVDGVACSYNNECQSLACKGGSCVEATQQAAYCLQ